VIVSSVEMGYDPLEIINNHECDVIAAEIKIIQLHLFKLEIESHVLLNITFNF